MTTMELSNAGFLDHFAGEVIKQCSTAVDNLLPYVLSLMAVILMWNIITNWDLYWGKQDFSKLIPLLVTATFFVALASTWGYVLDTVYEFGTEVAITASSRNDTGNSKSNTDGNDIKNNPINKVVSIGDNKFLSTVTPSTIVSEGVDNAITVFTGHILRRNPNEDTTGKKVQTAVRDVAAVMSAGVTGNAILAIVYALITLLLFGFIAVSYLYTILEFFIIGSISMVLLPFGLLDKTKPLIDKLLNFFFVSAIRIAIFLFLVLLINQFIVDAYRNASFTESLMGVSSLSAMVSLFALAFLAFKTPSFAAALFNGAINSPPSMTGGAMTAMQTAIMLKTLGASKAAAATKEGGKAATSASAKQAATSTSQTGSTAIQTARKDAIQDTGTTSSNKGGSTTSTTKTAVQESTTQTNTNSMDSSTIQDNATSHPTNTAQKDAIRDGDNYSSASSKEQPVSSTDTNITPTTQDTPTRQMIDNYQDRSEGTIKDTDAYHTSDGASHTDAPQTNHSLVQEMIQSEQSSVQTSSSQQTRSNAVTSTIKEFKLHELQSNKDTDE